METNDAVGNVPIIVPTAETPVENPVTADVNPAETAETPCGHETVTETPKRVCEHCGKEISDPHAVVYTTHDGKTICCDCYDEHYFMCEDCGEIHPRHDWYDVGNGGYEWLVCGSCREDHWRQCCDCGGWIDTDSSEGTYVESVGDYVCESCLRDYSRCDCCGEYFRDADLRSVYDNRLVCESCFEDHYFTCESCGETFGSEGMVLCDGEELCQSCAERRNVGSGLMEYHAGRKLNMYSPRRESSESYKENLFFGVELECERGDFDADDFTDWTDDSNLIHFERDGSLDEGGVEMITQPCTLLYHQREIGWTDLCSRLVRQGFLSNNAENCGLHVHLSRAALRPTTIVKMDVFINRAKSFWSQVARRDVFYGCGGRYEVLKRASLAKGNFKRGDYQGDRYTAVNTNNRNTVEIRIFRGTLKTETILGTIEILHGLVRFLDTLPITRIYETEANVVRFIDFLAWNRAKYPNVFPMLRRLVRRGEGMRNQIGKYYGQFCESQSEGENY